MQASDVLKMKLQSERLLALYAQQGVTSTWKAMKGIGSDIYAGVERVSWYSSCLVPDYHEVCRELISEEKRMHLSILSVFRHRNVIAHMFRLYFEMLINDSNAGNKSGRIRNVTSKITEVANYIPTGRATRLALALALAKALAASDLVSQTVVERLARRIPAIVITFQLIGTDQKCALAARQLKALDAEYYRILYQAEIEMFYYFIEPVFSELIKKYQIQFQNDFDGFYSYVKEAFHV